MGARQVSQGKKLKDKLAKRRADRESQLMRENADAEAVKVHTHFPLFAKHFVISELPASVVGDFWAGGCLAAFHHLVGCTHVRQLFWRATIGPVVSWQWEFQQ